MSGRSVGAGSSDKERGAGRTQPTPKVLLLAPWFPWPPHDGSRIRMLEILRYLKGRYEVTLLAHAEPNQQPVPEVEELCARVEVFPLETGALARLARTLGGALRGLPLVQAYQRAPAMAARVAELTRDEAFDVVHVEFPFIAHYLHSIHPSCSARRVLSTHNVESRRLASECEVLGWGPRRAAIRADQWLRPRWEQAAASSFDSILAVSRQDHRWFEGRVPTASVWLAPNGVDVEAHRPAAAAGPSRLVFLGLLSHPPNADAVVWFAEEILDRVRAEIPDLALDVIGRDPPPAVRALDRHPGVRVTGEVADVRPYLEASMALVVPLRAGGGTRLKILQAMAMARPVVSTSLGAEGLEVSHRDDILIADQPAEFAENIIELARSAELRERIGEAARKTVEQSYRWTDCLLALDSAYTGSP